MTLLFRNLAAVLAGATFLHCGPGNGTGKISVIIEPESVIRSGLSAGTGRTDVMDGWDVRFDTYLMALGKVRLLEPQSDTELTATEVLLTDLVRTPTTGEALVEFDAVGEGRYDVFYSQVEVAKATLGPGVTEKDRTHLLDHRATHWIRGSLTQTGGRSCPPNALANVPANVASVGMNSAGDRCYAADQIDFDIAVGAPVTYGPCAIDGLPGVSVKAGQSKLAALTIHGDHLFFNGFPEGDEGSIRRLAQWLADCDLDQDGTVTQDELAQIPLTELSEVDSRFQLGGSPLPSMTSALDYVQAQLSTQGHFAGEGECAIEL